MPGFNALGMSPLGMSGLTTLSQPVPPPAGSVTDVTMDANLVPKHRWLTFEGTSRVVTFEGNNRTIPFDGTNRTVRF